MLRQKMMGKTLTGNSSFLNRGEEIQRIEGFSDAVFGFTVTLLVVSLEVPKTFQELLDTMHDFFAFGVSFALLMSIWYWQYLFFRRFGLRDRLTILLNMVLLFVVLFYAYPLKFLWKLIFDLLLGYETSVPGENGTRTPVLTDSQGPLMMLIYGLGFIAINGVLALLYWHAYRQRNELELSPLEKFDTVSVGQTHLINILVAIISIIVALTTGQIALAGFIYFLVPLGIFGYRMWRKGQRSAISLE